jgi:hypothetical protein
LLEDEICEVCASLLIECFMKQDFNLA